MNKFYYLILCFSFFASSIFSSNLLKIKFSDRILIVAPHPDDAILSCGGIIQESIAKGAKVHILYITDGEHNRLSLFYCKKLFKLRNINKFIELGEIRKQEAIKGCEIVGLNKKDLIFLDYPDGGLYKIFLKYWGRTSPYVDDLTKSSYIEKGEGITPFAPYKGESILKDIKKVFQEVKPTKLFMPTPFDDNRDHLATYLFCELTLLKLNSIKPEQFLYLVHKSRVSLLERYNPKWCEKVSGYFDNKYSDLCTFFYLTQKQEDKKKKAIEEYKSQMYCKNFLLSFAKNKEVFNKSIPDVNLADKKNEFVSIGHFIDKNGRKIQQKVSIKIQDKNFIIKTKVPVKEEEFRGNIFIFGFKKNVNFSTLPKIHIGIRNDKYAVYDKSKSVFSEKDTYYKLKGKNAEIKIPLKLLGNPEKCFFYTEFSYLLNKYSIPWRILTFK